jgi:hypothetical protein
MICSQCNIDKDISCFYVRNDKKKNKYRKNCKDCSKKYYINNKERIKKLHIDWETKNPIKRIEYNLKKFGLNFDEYQNLLQNQGGSCAICKESIESLPKALAVDHCHASGKVRGLLCGPCNLLLGNAKDNLDILKAAIDYLTKNKLKMVS